VGKLTMMHQFTLYPEKPSIDETFVLSNQGNSTIHINSLRFGFTRLLTDDVGRNLTKTMRKAILTYNIGEVIHRLSNNRCPQEEKEIAASQST